MIDRTDRDQGDARRRYSLDPDDPDRWHDGVISGLLAPRYLGRMLMEPMREAGLEPRAVKRGECEECIEGSIDTGGFTPWGDPIEVGCEACKGSGTLPYDCMDLVGLEAYCGDPRARDLVGCPTVKVAGFVLASDYLDRPEALPDWLTGLERLASKLPRTPETKGECDCGRCFEGHCSGHGLRVESCPFCVGRCNGTGKTTHPGYAAEHYLLVAAAHAVAREVYRASYGRGSSSHARRVIERALDACAAWLACPCPKHEAVRDRAAQSTRWLPAPWLTSAGIRDAIQATAEILGPEKTRTLAAAAVRKALTT